MKMTPLRSMENVSQIIIFPQYNRVAQKVFTLYTIQYGWYHEYTYVMNNSNFTQQNLSHIHFVTNTGCSK